MDYFNQTSERLHYRKIDHTDIEAWVDFFRDNKQLAFVGVKDDKEPQALSTDWVTSRIERYKTEEYGLLSAFDEQTGELVGMAGIIPTELEHQNYYQIGYSVKPRFWNQGYASEMALQMQNFAEKHVQTSMLIAVINHDNIHSIRIAEKMGMSLWKETNFKGSDVQVYATHYV